MYYSVFNVKNELEGSKIAGRDTAWEAVVVNWLEMMISKTTAIEMN